MASSQTIAEAVENSLNAYNIISKKHLESVSYDTTVKAKIVDIKNRNFGEYKVNDGTSIYYAYSDKTDYYNGQMVWVVIPNGDYSQQKIIQGKYIESDNSEPFAYVSPLNSFVDMTQNLIEPGMVNETGLIANKSAVSEITLWAIFGRSLVGYDKLAIQAGFKSWLKSLNVYTGEYGLRLDIVSNVTGTSQTNNNRKIYQIYLNTNDFYGDVYNFETFYNQVKVVDISMIDCIESMSLVFYQSNNFQDSQGNFIPITNFDNIWMKDPYISLGFDASKFTTDTVLLSTADSITYAPFLSKRAKEDMIASLDPFDFPVGSPKYTEMANNIMSDDKTIAQLLDKLNTKNMTANYIHIDENGKAVVYGPSVGYTEDADYNQLPEGATIHWYQWIWEEGINDELAGPYWEEITDKLGDGDKFKYNNFVPKITRQSERFKVIIEYPSRENIAEKIYNGDYFERFVDSNGVEIYKAELLDTESYYDWVITGLDLIEKTKQEAINNLNAPDRKFLREAEAALYAEYLRVLDEAGLTPNQAAADDINIEYRKKIMNIKIVEQDRINSYSDLYNEIIGILGEAVTYTSAILEFTNEEEVANAASVQLLKGLSLEVDDDYHGNYHIYDEQGTIISKSESQKKRTITAKWNSIVSGERGLRGIETIEWQIPVVNTMIEYPEYGVEYVEYERITFDTQVDFAAYPYAIYRWDPVEEKYVALQNRDGDYRREYYRKTLCEHEKDDIGHPYFSIIRPVNTFEDHEPGTEEASLSGQVFRIKEFYNENLVNNIIKCIVTKNSVKYEAEFTLTFGPTGTAGTDFTFELEFANKVSALTLEEPNSTITVIPHLYNYENKDVITDYLSSLEYGWYSPRKLDGTMNEEFIIDSNTGKTNITITANNPSMEQVQYYILGASIEVNNINGKNIVLKAKKPVPVRVNGSYVSIDGADRVSYDSSGTNPSYYKDPYKLYTYRDKATVEVDNVKWKVVYNDGENTEQYYPTLTDKYNLVPLSVYLRDSVREVAVNCLDSQNNILWTQPLYIYQNEYTSALLNSWDGSLTFDKENGIILSRTVGAGSKDDYNRYQGVLMGDVAQVDNTPIYGLYGYDAGIQSFGFKIDGTAFIGKNNKGQINFDGNSGQISSLSYNINPQNPTGMLIDLDDGIINMKGAKVSNISYIDEENNEILYSVIKALEYRKLLATNKIAEYMEVIRNTNNWDAQTANAITENKITEEQKTVTDASDVIAYFETIEDYTDEDVYNYLKEHNLLYLVNNSFLTPVYENNNSAVRVAVTNPYFTITSKKDNELIRIADDAYHLQTDDYQVETFNNEGARTQNGKGLKIDLDDGFIDGYNFRLKGVNTKNNKLKNSYFEINSSGDPFLQVHYENDGDQNRDTTVVDLRTRGYLGENQSLIKDLFLISNNKFLLQSKDYFECEFNQAEISGYRLHDIDPSKAGEGFFLDLHNGKLESHNFDLLAVNSEHTISGGNLKYGKSAGSYIMMSSSGDPYFRIHYQYIDDDTEVPEPSEPNYTKWDIIDKEGIYVNKNLDLINISNSAYSFYSRDFQRPGVTGVVRDTSDGRVYHTVTTGTSVGKGIHIDLSGNQILGTISGRQIKGSLIEAYSFLLDAYRPALTAKNPASRIRINSMASGAATGQKNVVYVPNENYSAKDEASISRERLIEIINEMPLYSDERIWQLTGYKEDSQSWDSETYQLRTGEWPITRMLVDEYDDPLQIGSMFSVTWEGKVKSNWIEATTGGKIGPFTMRSKALYSNNGKLSNGKEFYDSTGTAVTEPEPQGVYLGSDGISIRDKFVIYKMPINKIRGNKSNLNNLKTHKMRIPIGYNAITKEQEFTDIKDFVSAGYYTNGQKTQYFIDCDPYDQSFKTINNNVFALGDLSFFLNGNSVLNGVTAINGNTYIFGHLQVGEYLDNIGTTTNQTNNSVTLYANTSVWGVFRTTGKTYIGDESGIWQDNESDLRENETTPNSRTKTNDSNLGAIIYRNTYITGYLKIGGGLVVGDFDNIKNQTTYDSTYLTSDFTAYVKNAKFFGDLEVAAGFIAGTKNSATPYDSNFPKVPWCDKDGNLTDAKPGSGIQARYIFLGRDPNYVMDNNVNQSTLQIYANTTQWGNFIAGNRGSKVELYANANGTASNAAYIKMSQGNGISIQTGKGNPFSLSTNGGIITLDATGGTGNNNSTKCAVLTLQAGTNDYIKFMRDNSAYNLDMHASGNVTLAGGNNNSISITKNGTVSINATGSINMSGGKGTFTIDDNGVSINGGSTNGTYGVDITGNTKISGDCDITGNISAANFHFDTTTNGGFQAGDTISAPTGGISNGIGGAKNGALWLGGWRILGQSFVSSMTNGKAGICLDPVDARIDFGATINNNGQASVKVDYIDGAGAGNSSKGMAIYSSAIVSIRADSSIYLNVGATTDFTTGNLYINSDGINLFKTTYLLKNGSNDTYFYLGGKTSGSNSTYWLKSDGSVSFNEASIKTLKIDEISAKTSTSGVDYITLKEGIKVDSVKAATASGSVLFKSDTGSTVFGVNQDSVSIYGNINAGFAKTFTFGTTDATCTFKVNGKPLGTLAFANYVKKKITINISRTLGSSVNNTKPLYVISDDDGTYYEHGDAVTYYTYSDSGYYYRAAFSDGNGDHSCNFVRADSISVNKMYAYKIEASDGSIYVWQSTVKYEIDEYVDFGYQSSIGKTIAGWVKMQQSATPGWTAGYNLYLAYSNPTSVSKPTSLTTVNTYKWKSAGSSVHKIEGVILSASKEELFYGVENESDSTDELVLTYRSFSND